MRTYVLRINFNNIRQEIEDNYFLYKDIFYKCFIVSVYLYYLNDRNIYKNIFIDNTHYWQYFTNSIDINKPVELMLYELGIDKYVDIFLSMNIYVDKFIDRKHKSGVLNIYSLDISDTYYLEIKNKQIKNSKNSLNIFH